MNEKIFVVEDETFFVNYWIELLEERNYDVRTAVNSKVFFAKYCDFKPDLVLLDLGLRNSELDGIGIYKKLLNEYNFKGEVIVISENTKIEKIVRVLKLGAFTYLSKDSLVREKILSDIENALNKRKQKLSYQNLLSENIHLRNKPENFDPFIGNSPQILNIKSKIKKIAHSDADVLIQGEMGTGKEVVANHIFLGSPKYRESFVKTNVAAINENLIESELFGHAKNSFTGAGNKNKFGKFEKAHNGTLFMDEIDSLSYNLQGILLRAIEHKEIEKVGGGKKKINFRLIVASNKNFNDLIVEKEFRPDLYYRLAKVIITIPPLRERIEDLKELLNYFLYYFKDKYNKSIEIDLTKVYNHLRSYHWPGNVRELKNFCDKLYIFNNKITDNIIFEEFEAYLQNNTHSENCSSEENLLRFGSYKKAVANYEKEFIIYHLKKNNWQQSLTAEKIGMDRTTLYRKIKKFNLTK